MLPFHLQQKIQSYNITNVAVMIKYLIKKKKVIYMSFSEWYFESINHTTEAHEYDDLKSKKCGICSYDYCDVCLEKYCECDNSYSSRDYDCW